MLNPSGFTFFARDRKYSLFHEHSKNLINLFSVSCYKETVLQRIDEKMTIKWSFSYDSFVNFILKKIGSHNMTVLYSILTHLAYIANG